jgi:signal transduction histidine kinase
MYRDLDRRAGRAFYVAWLPMTALLVALLAAVGGRPLAEAALLGVPLCAVFALVTRSSWYMCRVLPLRRGAGLLRRVGSHVAAALTASALWVLLALGLGRALPLSAPVALGAEVPLLVGIGTAYYLLAVVYHYLVLALGASAEAEREAVEARALAREAELKALRAQLDPHFLFNALHSISALTALDAHRARDMTLALSEFLRRTSRLSDRARVTLDEELALARGYLKVESYRFADRLRVQQAINEACLPCRLPPLLLQPLVENAVRHGVAHLSETCEIRLEGRCQGDTLVLRVENDVAPDAPPSRGTGRGLALVRRRLRAQYGAAAQLAAGPVGSGAGEARYRVTVTLPAEMPAPEKESA